MNYTANKITVEADAWTEISPSHDIDGWSVYPIDGDIFIQLRDKNGWGDSIHSFSGVPAGDNYPANKIRIKAQTGSVVVAYYVRG